MSADGVSAIQSLRTYVEGYPQGGRIERHAHDLDQLTVITESAAIIETDDVYVVHPCMHALWLPAGVYHSIFSPRPYYLHALSSLSVAGEFIAYEGTDAVQEGTGGAKKTMDGVDFWTDGAPPRKFKLLGYISDTRHKTGLVGVIRMKGLEGSIAKQAKAVGGDAVILVGSEVETKGYIGTTNATVSGTARTSGNTTRFQGSSVDRTTAAAVQKQHTRYAVVKYIEDEPPRPG